MNIKTKATLQLISWLLSLASNHTLSGALFPRTPPPQNLLTGYMIVKWSVILNNHFFQERKGAVYRCRLFTKHYAIHTKVTIRSEFAHTSQNL